MEKTANLFKKGKFAIVALFLLLSVVSVLLIGTVRINYNISDYLDDSTDTKISLGIMEEHGIDTEYYKKQNHKVYHSLTAALIIPQEYEDFADSDLIRAVSVHTTGCADMTLFDKLLYLADYIEDTRTFPDCVALREYFYDGIERGEDKYAHLEKTMLLSFDMTLRDLIECGSVISDKTVEARNSLLYKAKKGE